MREFGPVFNASHFLLPVLDLQKRIESVVAEDGTTFQEVCNAPLSPQSTICNVQSLWAYWQDDAANLNLTGLNEATGHVDTYLDHFLMCSRNPANPSDGLVPPQSCMSRGGIPVQPYFVLGGFVDENATHFPKDPQYSKASAVVITLLVDNYDIHSNGIIGMRTLKQHFHNALLPCRSRSSDEASQGDGVGEGVRGVHAELHV